MLIVVSYNSSKKIMQEWLEKIISNRIDFLSSTLLITREKTLNSQVPKSNYSLMYYETKIEILLNI